MTVSSTIMEADLPQATAFDRFHPFIKGVFSQWHPTPFAVDGLGFDTAEQWMMFSKARLFADDERAALILATPDPATQKRLGQQVQNFDQATWDASKISIVYAGNRAKFEQNEGAHRQLKSTNGSMLVEANPRDWIWGAGLAIDDPRVSQPQEWRGENLLGRILTKVRSDLG
ncbi:MAG: NADAR family protein [Brevundimonas sp.]|uniref:NADAR family protein n=1 Tax=Brevundimonas sp. TaxID=1871086 RepID=UPI002ABC119B|nr:NADAR family protein [Brevundimonas sp.]MDZ4108575.1 NADAR family protein [Brevundimonas sp.]